MKRLLALAGLLLEVCLAVNAQQVDTGPKQYYRIRISFNTKSDWASLTTSDPRVLLGRHISSQGAAKIHQMTTRSVLIGQDIAGARTGQAVGVLVDFAINPVNLDKSPIVFTMNAGDLGNSWSAIWNVNGSTNTLLQLADTLTMGSSRRWTFSLNSAALTALPPVQLAAWQTPSIEKKAWAFFYPWYPYLSNWNDPLFRDLPAVLYSSGDTAAIARQITQAKGAGLDGFISSWSGPGDWTDRFLRPVLDGAQAQSFSVTPYLEILDASGNPRSPATLVSWIEYLLSNYGSHPAMYKIDGKPVIYVWATYALPQSTWADIFKKVRASGLDALFIGMGTNVSDLRVFDGLHLYGYNDNTLPTLLADLKPQVKYYHLLADMWAPTRAKLWVPGVAPGYDESRIPGRAGRVQPRNGGSYYQSQWEALITANPDWIALTSWNEFFENTHLEPSTNYGDQYTRQTAKNVDKWRAQR